MKKEGQAGKDPGKRRYRASARGRHRVKGEPRAHDGNIRPSPPGFFAPCPPPTTPKLRLCPGHAGVCQCLSKCRALHLSSGSLKSRKQKPPFVWLRNKPLGKPMRQQLDQLQRPSAHISVPGQACWHPAKLFWASPTAWSSCVGPMAAICGGASKGLETWEVALLTSPASAPAGCLGS